MERNMSRPLSFVLAAALAASTAMTAAPAAAHDPGFGVTVRSGEWNNGWDNDWRWRQNRHRGHVAPGFYFNFGVPFPHTRVYYRPNRDCFRDWDGSRYCRY